MSVDTIVVEFYWGDMVPYYGNASTSTEVTIGPRLAQSAVLSTPPSFYFFNATAVIEYSDYLTGDAIVGALVTFECLNVSSFIGGFKDNTDGTYEIWVNIGNNICRSYKVIGRFTLSV